MSASNIAALDVAAGDSSPTVAVRPVVLSAPDRGDDLQVRVSAPTTGSELPIIVFSHGFGESMDSYTPLSDFWAAHGFVVIQPTHLDSRTLGVAPDDPRTPRIWRIRVDDLTRILDHLDHIEASVPGLSGRVDRERIAAAGHSYGAQTASNLLGARVLDVNGRPGEDMTDARVKAGVLLSLTGTGGGDLTPFAAETFPFMNADFAQLSTSALAVAGDHDQSFLSTRGPDWFTDGYRLSPGVRDLLVLAGGEHSLGGISGHGAAATTDEDPARVALVQRLTTAYLRTALGVEGPSWAAASAAVAEDVGSMGRLDSK
ncbi:MAG: chlorophyllase [Actinomycetota bacterium]|nr:chlorophyllase [Actinomycetota bacterium]